MLLQKNMYPKCVTGNQAQTFPDKQFRVVDKQFTVAQLLKNKKH